MVTRNGCNSSAHESRDLDKQMRKEERRAIQSRLLPPSLAQWGNANCLHKVLVHTSEQRSQESEKVHTVSFPHAPHREKEALGLVNEIAGVPTVHHIGENLPQKDGRKKKWQWRVVCFAARVG